MKRDEAQARRVGRVPACILGTVLLAGSGWAADSPILRWSGNDHYYQFVDSWLSWTDAEAAAEARGGYLVTITSQAEQDWIVQQFITANRHMCWIGLVQDKAPTSGAWAPDEHWNWVTGEPVVYTNWRASGPKEPNDSGPPEDNQENYGHITDVDGAWNDLRPVWGDYIGYLVEWNSSPYAPSPPALTWFDAEGYRTDGLDPDGGDPMATPFHFRVRYQDVNADPPQSVKLAVRRMGGTAPASTFTMRRGVGTEASGVTYGYTLRLPSGSYEYCFRAHDKDGEATGEPTQWHAGPAVGNLPVLAWVGTPGYESDGVEPGAGEPRQTRFAFRVQYTDADGDAPGNVVLQLRKNGEAALFCEVALRSTGGDYAAGVVYGTWLTLRPGAYRHRFKAWDHNGKATGPATNWTPGPTVTDAAPLLVTGLAAQPTAVGAQITFTLSATARIEACISSIAGRPVRSLGQDLPAGTGVLLWDARSDTGLTVPDGMYVVEIIARAPNGGCARALTQVRIAR